MPTSNGFFYTDNAGTAESRGGEMELAIKASQNLKLNINLALVDSEITESVIDSAGNITIAKGNEMPFTPGRTASVTFDYARPISEGLWGVLYGRYTYRSAHFAEVNNLSEAKNGDYNQVYLRFGLEGGSWSAFGFVDNLLNRDDTTTTLYDDPLVYSTFVRPRTFGVELRWQY